MYDNAHGLQRNAAQLSIFLAARYIPLVYGSDKMRWAMALQSERRNCNCLRLPRRTYPVSVPD
jgi:hypothetical protein